MPRRYKADREEDHDENGRRSERKKKKKKPKPEPPPAIPREETEEERRELMRRLRRKKKKTTEGAGLSLADRIQVQRKIEEQNRQIQEENANYNMSLGSLAVSELDAVDSRSRLEEVKEEGQGSRDVLLTTVAEEDSVAPVIENNANGTLTPVETPEMQRAPDFAPMEPGYYDVTTGCTTQMIDGTVHHVSNRRIRSSSTMRQRCVDLRKTKSSFEVTAVTPKEQTARIRMNEQTSFAGQGNNYQYRSYEEMYVLHPHQRPKTAVIPTRNDMLVRRIQSSKPNLASRKLVVKDSSSRTVERGSSVTMVVSDSNVNSETNVIKANQETEKIKIDRSHYVDAAESKCCDCIDVAVARTELVQVITGRERSAENIVVIEAEQTAEMTEKNVAMEENRVATEVIVVTKEEDRVAKEVIVVAKEEDMVANESVVVAQNEETTKSELNKGPTETDLNVKVVETNSTVVTETKITEEDTKLILVADDTTDEKIDLWIKESEEKSKDVTEIKTEKGETEDMEKDKKDVDIKLVADVENEVVTVKTKDAPEPQPEEVKDTEIETELVKDAVAQEPNNDEEGSKDSESQSMSNSEVSLHLAVSLDGEDSSPGTEPTMEELQDATPEPTVVSKVEEMPKEDVDSKQEVPEKDVPIEEGTADTKDGAAEEELAKEEEVSTEEVAPNEEEVPIEEEGAKDADSPSPSKDVPKEEETPKEDEPIQSPVVEVVKPLTPKASPPRKRPSTSQPHGNKSQLDIPNKPNRHSSLDTRAMEKMIADMEKKVDDDLSSILNPPGAPKPIPAWEKEKNKETMKKLLNDEFFEEGDEDLLQGFIKDG
ncbi:titin-like [Lineus longissimus]|uniref:titin-like n=1 Tax=Lineus longissimus TaxID=88925 RepID=UPI00315D137B